jgi:hypothetical protein
MYSEITDKVFVVDYFVYNPNNPQRRIFTYMLGSSSRKTAEQATRDLEKGSKITIVKIQSLNSNEIPTSYEGNEYSNEY